MPWYKLSTQPLWKIVVIFVVATGFFAGMLSLMVMFTDVSYRLSEVRYTIQPGLDFYFRQGWTGERISSQISASINREVVLTIEGNSFSLFYPHAILTAEEVQTIDSWLRTSFSNVAWSAPHVRSVPRLAPVQRKLLLGVLALAMGLGVAVSWAFRRE